ncbi:MAG TPA: cytochrome c [Gemmatimonadales bacterium]|nr:cytochrome c [Gemmatimonadales bacterium]
MLTEPSPRFLTLVTLGVIACGGEKQPAPPAAEASPPAQAAAPASGGEEAYQICATCHQATGLGIPNAFPPLAGSDFVNGPGAPHIAIVLKGLTGPLTVRGQNFNGVMAPWESLSDDQIAAAINYERGSWGNTGAPVTAADVARIRQAIATRTTPWTAADLEKAGLR